MSTALVVMTILGCDDAVTSCHYVETVKGSWTSISACDTHSQTVLPRFTNRSYPVIVALCEKQDEGIVAQSGMKPAPPAAPALPEAGADLASAAAVPPAPVPAAPVGQGIAAPAPDSVEPPSPTTAAPTATTLEQIDPAPVPPEPPGLTAIPARAYDFLRNQLPGRDALRRTLTAPVHYVGEGYSWVAHRIVPDKP
ncbi:hypothetical protein BTR14_00260 [Rhizobium rhizosphaerae]|uniref:Uncharacterized protein n=1 Tax=Xaviernesmea rhizosphaerae TaxID=1672749 RepID=A0ABX3PIJ1_9HYPH|nr:hypothetical protein [Xaviernesmea rhizosphaerae]OQP87961.1 hypothetical protein BTR14_00260 [Xaviernesmea rhizosphaerae]